MTSHVANVCVEPRIPVAMPDLSGNESRYVAEAVQSTWISSTGVFLDRFEAQFAEACGARFCLGVSNGTTALHLALAGLNLSPGDEVIVPSLTYVATANAVRYCGGVPVFADVDPETWCIGSDTVEPLITPRTKGIVVVHLLGQPADMDPILQVASTHGLWVVEDAAEAPFATYKRTAVGGIGHVAAFSFYGNKLITSGEGGAITFSDPHLERRFRMLRGQGMDPERRYHFPIVGFNYRMTNIAAAILCAQMERKDEILQCRKRIWAKYDENLRDIPGVRLRPRNTWSEVSPWMFVVLIDPHEFGMHRDELAGVLYGKGIETRPMFIPLHTLPPYRSSKSEARPLRVTDQLGEDGLMLPTYSLLKDSQIDLICNAIAEQAHSAAYRGRHAA